MLLCVKECGFLPLEEDEIVFISAKETEKGKGTKFVLVCACVIEQEALVDECGPLCVGVGVFKCEPVHEFVSVRTVCMLHECVCVGA